jgi:hypothetical protein
MSEAGKEIILVEALATHMRSSRDRDLLSSILQENRPLEDVLSFFAAFYLYNYQGLRLLSMSDDEQLTIEKKKELSHDERRYLEMEIREILENRLKEETDIERLVSEFALELLDLSDMESAMSELTLKVVRLIGEYLEKIPRDYSPNSALDFILGITGWRKEWLDELYAKASGLKESSLSLRDELLREHEAEVVETSVLTRLVSKVADIDSYMDGPLIPSDIPDRTLVEIARASIEFLLPRSNSADVSRMAHLSRIELLDWLAEELDSLTTLGALEERMADRISHEITTKQSDSPDNAFEFISRLVSVDEDVVRSGLASKGLRDANTLLEGLRSFTSESAADEAPTQYSAEELEDIERSLRTLEKLEHTLEKPVKGMLRARGLRADELEKVSIDILAKESSQLIAIESQVLEELKKKMRVPSREAFADMLKARELVESGGLKAMGVSSSTDMTVQRRHGEAIAALRMDLVWHLMIGVLKNLARVVETYLRSKQDLLRSKALLISIYQDATTELQFLREEILIDLLSERILEMKRVHPHLDGMMIRAWMHARLSNQYMTAAREELEKTPSPVFEGVIDEPLRIGSLSFDNYSIAFDLMQRFLKRERKAKLAKEELALEAKREEKRLLDKKKREIDVLSFIYTKAHTVFRATGRVGTSGLEWDENDSAKCSNMLSFFVRTNRGRPVCQVCGTAPKDGKCETHGTGQMKDSDDIDNLSVFVMRALSDIKSGLMGPTAEPISWSEARSIVQRQISRLKQKGKITSKMDLKHLMPGEINYVIGPTIASVIAEYFNDSLGYAARRAGIA